MEFDSLKKWKIYNTYIISEISEFVPFDEYYLIVERKEKYRQVEPIWKKAMKYGIVGVIGSAVTAGIGLPIALLVYYIYRQATDECVKSCGHANKECINRCYYRITGEVVKRLEWELTQLHKIEDPKRRDRIEKRLEKELDKWKEKHQEYKEKVERTKHTKASD